MQCISMNETVANQNMAISIAQFEMCVFRFSGNRNIIDDESFGIWFVRTNEWLDSVGRCARPNQHSYSIRCINIHIVGAHIKVSEPEMKLTEWTSECVRFCAFVHLNHSMLHGTRWRTTVGVRVCAHNAYSIDFIINFNANIEQLDMFSYFIVSSKMVENKSRKWNAINILPCHRLK